MTRKRSKRAGKSPSRPTKRGQARRRALKAVSLMRKGVSLRKAARRAHTTPRTVARHAGSALRRTSGSYQA